MKSLTIRNKLVLSLLMLVVPLAASALTAGHPFHSHWQSILPPLIAIASALLFREVLLSLLLGLFTGALLIKGNLFSALLYLPGHLFWNMLADKSHAAIILFTMFLGGMVGILSHSGAMQGLVNALSKLSKTRRGGMLFTWLMGLLIFFDDYANTLLIGQTMQPYTDKLKISRAKLAYIVDSTAAPVTSLALVSTWIGFEVGLLRDSIQTLMPGQDAYSLFLQSIPYRFYSLFTLILVFSLAFWNRDFSAMRSVEMKTIEGSDPSRVEKTKTRPRVFRGPAVFALLSAFLPVIAVIILTFTGLYFSGVEAAGKGAPFFQIIGAADSSRVLLVSSFAGIVIAALCARYLMKQKTVSVGDGLMEGFRSMLPAITILLLAWSLGAVCSMLGTAEFVIGAVTGFLNPSLLPMVIFLVAAVTAFSTGTSWGTMAILIPIAVPLAFSLTSSIHEPAMQSPLFLGSVGAVLAGSTFGDHCSPISDTTILSSMASGSDHIIHVRTQIPYALTTALIAVGIGYLPAGFHVTPLITLTLGAILIFLFPKLLKKHVQ